MNFSSFMKGFKPRGMTFSSNAFACNYFSFRCQGPPVDIPSHEAPRPILETSVYMTLEISGYCKLFDTNIMLSLHHFKSRSASFDSVTLHSKLPFDFFSVYVLHLYNALYYRGPSLFPGKVAVKVPIRLANTLIFKNSFSR